MRARGFSMCTLAMSVFSLYVFFTKVENSNMLLRQAYDEQATLRNQQLTNYSNITLHHEHSSIHVLGNLRNFSFITNNDVCAHQNVSIMIVVPSHPLHRNTRTVLRTVYNRRINGHVLKAVFLLGDIKIRKSREAIVKENDVHHDIIQGNFVDGYHSVAYNHLQGLKWATTFCKQATYIIKVDDDIYLNLHRLVKVLFSLPKKFQKKIFCSLWFHAPPIRDPTSKYYVSETDYPQKEFPTYCNGWVVVYPQNVARKIVDISSQISFLWMSDVFIAGICPNKANIGFVDMNPYYLYDIQPVKKWYDTSRKMAKFLAGPTNKNVTFLQMLHDKSDRLYDRWKARTTLTFNQKWRAFMGLGDGSPTHWDD